MAGRPPFTPNDADTCVAVASWIGPVWRRNRKRLPPEVRNLFAELLLALRLHIMPVAILDDSTNIGRSRYDVRGISELLRHLAVRHTTCSSSSSSGNSRGTCSDSSSVWAVRNTTCSDSSSSGSGSRGDIAGIEVVGTHGDFGSHRCDSRGDKAGVEENDSPGKRADPTQMAATPAPRGSVRGGVEVSMSPRSGRVRTQVGEVQWLLDLCDESLSDMAGTEYGTHGSPSSVSRGAIEVVPTNGIHGDHGSLGGDSRGIDPSALTFRQKIRMFAGHTALAEGDAAAGAVAFLQYGSLGHDSRGVNAGVEVHGTLGDHGSPGCDSRGVSDGIEVKGTSGDLSSLWCDSLDAMAVVVEKGSHGGLGSLTCDYRGDNTGVEENGTHGDLGCFTCDSHGDNAGVEAKDTRGDHDSSGDLGSPGEYSGGRITEVEENGTHGDLGVKRNIVPRKWFAIFWFVALAFSWLVPQQLQEQQQHEQPQQLQQQPLQQLQQQQHQQKQQQLDQTASTPVLQVRVEGLKVEHELTFDDLLKVFGRYGEVDFISVADVGTAAVVRLVQPLQAIAAQKDLDRQQLNGYLGAVLRVEFEAGSFIGPMQTHRLSVPDGASSQP